MLMIRCYEIYMRRLFSKIFLDQILYTILVFILFMMNQIFIIIYDQIQNMQTYKKKIQNLIKQAYLKEIEWQMSDKSYEWFYEQWTQFTIQFEDAVYKLDHPKIKTIRQLCNEGRCNFTPWQDEVANRFRQDKVSYRLYIDDIRRIEGRQRNGEKVWVDIAAIRKIHEELQNVQKDITNKIRQQQAEAKERIERQKKQVQRLKQQSLRQKKEQQLKAKERIEKQRQQAEKSKQQSLRQKKEQKEKEAQNLRKNKIFAKNNRQQSDSEEDDSDENESSENSQQLQELESQEPQIQEDQSQDYQDSDQEENQSDEQQS